MTIRDALLAVMHGPLRGMDPAVGIELSPEDYAALGVAVIEGVPVTVGDTSRVITRQGAKIPVST